MYLTDQIRRSLDKLFQVVDYLRQDKDQSRKGNVNPTPRIRSIRNYFQQKEAENKFFVRRYSACLLPRSLFRTLF